MNTMTPKPDKGKFFQQVKQQKDRAALEAAAALPDVLQTPTFTLALRPPRKEGAKGIYYMMRNGVYYRSLKVYEDQPEEAEARYELAVQQELAKLHGIVPERQITIAAVIDYILDAPPHKNATKSEKTYFNSVRASLIRLKRYFPGKTLGDITTKTIAAYRNMEIPKVYGTGFVGARTLRNDMEHLKRACNKFSQENGLGYRAEISLGRMPDSNRSFLLRDELARLFMACRGYIWDHETGDYLRHPVPEGSDADPKKMPYVRRSKAEIRRREPIRRLALIMWKTGTRIDATLSLSWKRFKNFGYINLAERTIHRLGYAAEQAGGKKQAVSALPYDLLVHLRAWHRKDSEAGIKFLIHKPFGPPTRYTSLPASAWTETIVDAGLPLTTGTHELCHTCITHALMEGESFVLVAQWTGRSPLTILKNYLHHDIVGQLRAMGNRQPRRTRFDLDGEADAPPSRRYRMYEKSDKRPVSARAQRIAAKRMIAAE